MQLINPVKLRAGGSWAAVQRRHSLLQCGNTVNLQLHLLQAVLVPVLQYGCQMWGMRVAAANYARSDLQRLYDCYLRTICDLLPSTPRKMLLAESGLLPLQVFWWRQALQSWNSLAALPAGSFYHTVCLDNLTDAFGGGACNMASSLAGCLHSVGYDMLRVCDVIPILNVDNISIVGVLTTQLQDMGNGALYCPRVAPTRVLSLALMSSGLGHTVTAFVGVIVICLCLAGACGAFCSLGLVVMACLVLLVLLLTLLMLTRLRGCACLAIVVPSGTRGT